MGNARNVGGVRARSGRHRRPRAVADAHYLTSREAAVIAHSQRAKDEARGIFRRWNDRRLTPEEMTRVQPQPAAHRRRTPPPRPSAPSAPLR